MSEATATVPDVPQPFNLLRAVLDFFTSLKLAVVLLAVSAVLVFLGTIAQVNEGLYEAQSRWFKQWMVIRQEGDPWWVLIYPGGYLLGVLLIVNLMGAHLRRFKFPPGGLPLLIAHYLIIMAALYAVTYFLLWSPFWFFAAGTALMAVELLMASGNMGWKPLVPTGRKIGVDMIHFGIVVLLVGQLATDMLAVETNMSFREGETMHYSENRFDAELVLLRDVPGDVKNDEVISIPQALLVKNDQPEEKELSHEKLPFTVKLKSWQANSELINLAEAREHEASLRQAFARLESLYATPDNLVAEARTAMESPGRLPVWNQALRELGQSPGKDIVPAVEAAAAQPDKAAALLTKLKQSFRKEMLDQFKKRSADMRFAAMRVEEDAPITESSPAPQASTDVAKRYHTLGVKKLRDMESRNVPAAVVELSGSSGSLGTWLVSPLLKEQTIDYGGAKWRLVLRFERSYLPYSIKLLKTTHEVYAGTDTPKDFRSRLLIDHPAKNEQREAEVFMNAPLRYEGLTFFQYQMGKDELDSSRGTSALQVVKNPSWFSPYFGCALVGYGMLRHFLLHLTRFIRKRKTS